MGAGAAESEREREGGIDLGEAELAVLVVKVGTSAGVRVVGTRPAAFQRLQRGVTC